MKNLKIRFRYMSNTVREEIASFAVEIEDDIKIENIISRIELEWIKYSKRDFVKEKLWIQGDKTSTEKFCNDTIKNLINDNDELIVTYSEVVLPESAANIDFYLTRKGDRIDFNMFPRELNHRFTPHVSATCKGETIRITLMENPQIFGDVHFSGNNSKNEKIAMSYVRKNLSKFRHYWYKYVESQF
ncbi:MAG: hypothetical protein Q4C59_09825 [Lachnospiraceae bacterium]|nr:hypothetical protein [Lachnospiraceae bacterium]